VPKPHTDLVTLEDVRRAKLCARGARQFCQVQGWDWEKIRTSGGVPVEKLISANHPIANQVVEAYRGRQ
jgi:hypothetical protein